MNSITEISCPCGTGKKFADCCAPYIQDVVSAPNAEALMRSRYSAYTISDEAYLRATWDERTCPKERIVHQDATKWLGLEVKRHQVQKSQNSQDGQEKEAIVEFVARYKIAGKAYRLHEISRFVKYDGKWLYVDGIQK
ncbi:MAG: SEC-C domain-containing protein [Undibacterium sp.]|nr:SEC-C domain-containing protein [Undibacterium sp.]